MIYEASPKSSELIQSDKWKQFHCRHTARYCFDGSLMVDSFYLCMYVAGICVTCAGCIPVHQFLHSCLGLKGDPASFTQIRWDMQSIEHVMVLPRVLLSEGRVQKTSGGNCTGSILIRSWDHLSRLFLPTKKQWVYSFRIYSTSPPPCPWGWALVNQAAFPWLLTSVWLSCLAAVLSHTKVEEFAWPTSSQLRVYVSIWPWDLGWWWQKHIRGVPGQIAPRSGATWRVILRS